MKAFLFEKELVHCSGTMLACGEPSTKNSNLFVRPDHEAVQIQGLYKCHVLTVVGFHAVHCESGQPSE
jgi:hypothetical protein